MTPLENLIKATGFTKYRFSKEVDVSPQALHHQLNMEDNTKHACIYAKKLNITEISGVVKINKQTLTINIKLK